MGSIWWYSTRAAGLVAWGLLDLPPEFFECLGRRSGGATDFNAICNAARDCDDLARLF